MLTESGTAVRECSNKRRGCYVISRKLLRCFVEVCTRFDLSRSDDFSKALDRSIESVQLYRLRVAFAVLDKDQPSY